MANPRPDLQGFADPSVPGWQERAIARVTARQRKSKRNLERTNGMYLYFDDQLRVLLDEACARRGISLAGYGRRAMIAFIAHDLGLELAEVAQHAAVPAAYGASGAGRQVRTRDNGLGKGLWRILGLAA
ncbi:MAG TPA: hypothetical protein DEP82_14515 [Arthrobacter bacterium]|jgi:hypothetical protein|nr:hypothetical protein [Arthrobacter sp.]HCB59085.1 hypothetical protein [Arthrobacter sp.]